MTNHVHLFLTTGATASLPRLDLFRAHLEEAALDEIRKAVQQGLPLGNDRVREQVEAALGRRVTLRRRGRQERAPSNALLPGQMGLDLEGA